MVGIIETIFIEYPENTKAACHKGKPLYYYGGC